MITSANLATIKARRQELPRMLDSIRKQVDVVRCYCNDYMPSDSQRNQFKNVEYYWGEDHTDRAKFGFVQDGEIYVTADDDLIYNNSYVREMKEFLEKNPYCIATYHGRKLVGKGLRYYQDHELFHFRNIAKEQKVLDVPGTGVTAFNTNCIKPNIMKYSEDCMADLLLGLEAAKNGWPIVGLPHGKDIDILQTAHQSSIYRKCRTNQQRQCEIADRIYELKYS